MGKKKTKHHLSRNHVPAYSSAIFTTGKQIRAIIGTPRHCNHT